MKNGVLALALGALLAACAGGDVRPTTFDELRYPFTVRRAALPQGEVAYVDEGGADAAETVVLIHGWVGDLRRWSSVVPFLSESRRVLALDLPGYGKSAKDDGKPYGVPLFADAVFSLLDHVGVEKAVLVGHSMGGQVAILAALRRPERVSRLVLVDASGMEPPPAYADLAAGEERLARPGYYEVERMASRVFFEPPAGFEDAVRERYALTLHDGYRAHAHAAALAYRSMKDTKLYYDATTIRAPTLIVWGAEDRIFHPRNALAWSRRIPGSLMAVIPRAGHAPFLERPEAFNRVIGEFLDVGRLPDLGDEYTIRDPALEEGAWSWLY